METYNKNRPKNIVVDIETLGLNPLEKEAKVIAIAVKCGEYEDVLMSTSEKVLLTKFWNLPFFHQYSRMVGFNISSFDLPFLLVRSYFKNVKLPPNIRGKVLDLRYVLSCGNKFAKGTLEDYGTLILGENGKKNGYSGEDIKKLWEEGKVKELKSYCRNDVRITENVLTRLIDIGVIE